VAGGRQRVGRRLTAPRPCTARAPRSKSRAPTCSTRRTCVSAREALGAASEAPGVELAACAVEIVELAAFRARARELSGISRGLGLELAAPGRAAAGSGRLSVCVRPGRWLLLLPPDSPGAQAALWQRACAGVAAALDHS